MQQLTPFRFVAQPLFLLRATFSLYVLTTTSMAETCFTEFTLSRDELEEGAAKALWFPEFQPEGIWIRLNPEHPAVLSTRGMDPEALIAAENGGTVPDNPSQDAGIKDQPGQKKMVIDLDAIMVIFGSF